MSSTITKPKPAEFISKARADLSYAAEHLLGLKLWSKQKEILRLMSTPRMRLAVRTGHGVSKTHAAAALVNCFLPLHRPCRVITTAPGWSQVRDLLWAELRTIHRDAPQPLGGHPDTTRWELGPDWFAVGVSTTEADRMQGRHSPHVLIIFDEASGVSPEIWEAAESLMSGDDARWLAIGNPTDPQSEFAKCFTDPLWTKMHISCLEAPNITGEMEIPGAVTQEWINEMASKWGADSPIYQARVLGQFPPDDVQSVIPWSWIVKAQARETDIAILVPRRIIGVDVARFGADRTTWVIRDDWKILFMETKNKSPTTETIGRTIQLAKEFSVAPRDICVDDTGVGGGVTDGLTERFEASVTPVNFGALAEDKEHFANRGAELIWRIREHLDPEPREGQGEQLCLPDDSEIAQELGRRYAIDSKGRIILEKKQDLNGRIGRSPDKADALALTYAVESLSIADLSAPWGDEGEAREMRAEFDKVFGEEQPMLED